MTLFYRTGFAGRLLLLTGLALALNTAAQQPVSGVWVADNSDGTYRNPVLYADYSDPDVVRVGEDFYMTASSFNCVPGLPILHSRDLVNWELKSYALPRLIPEEYYSLPRHGQGVWAPCIRYHDRSFYIFYPDPEFGIYMIRAEDPAGPWSEPVLVKGGRGLIDPSPLWDDDGKAYLVHAFAGSRAGIKSILVVAEMDPDGTKIIGNEVLVFDGHPDNPTVEGPKFYKRNGYYYIFAPAGGVTGGWQLALRSRSVFGPYESRIVLNQGTSTVNGPHQGAWVDTKTGEDWFIHFQDKGAYGRIVHLQPMTWKNNWPVMGTDNDGDGTGEPVLSYRKPVVGKSLPLSPPESDEFSGNQPGMQWQWHANPALNFGFPAGSMGFFRLNCLPRPSVESNLWEMPNLLLQKFPAGEFTATTSLKLSSSTSGDEAGFVVMGEDYRFISLKRSGDNYVISLVECKNAEKEGEEIELFSVPTGKNEVQFRIRVDEGAVCTFSYSTDGKKFRQVGTAFAAKPGRWIGAKIGYFARRGNFTNDSGTVDIDWFRIEK
ncbi:MAG: glycoside hydrolase 43 family protein [Bacteroidota bacterium]